MHHNLNLQEMKCWWPPWFQHSWRKYRQQPSWPERWNKVEQPHSV